MNNWKYNFFGGTDIDGKRLTWSGVVAGIFTFIAIFLTLSLIGFSIGLTTFNPISDNPLRHVGTNVTIWTIIALVISFAAGGFVSGLVANKAGFLHGFMTWATGLILVAFLVTNTIGGAFRVAGNAASSLAGGIGSGTSTLITKSGEALDKSISSLSANVVDIDTNQLQANIKDVLRDTEVKELQPDYLSRQIDETKKDLESSAKNILMQPDNYKSELKSLINNIEEREKTIANAIDKEAIANAVGENTDLSQEEAEVAVNNIYDEYQKASQQISKSLNETKTQIDKLSQEVEKATDEIRETADQAADTGAKSSLYLFIGLLIALFITGFSGIKGAEFLNR